MSQWLVRFSADVSQPKELAHNLLKIRKKKKRVGNSELGFILIKL